MHAKVPGDFVMYAEFFFQMKLVSSDCSRGVNTLVSVCRCVLTVAYGFVHAVCSHECGVAR